VALVEKKTKTDKPWASLQLQANPVVQSLFSMAMGTVIGDGNSTLFWSDRWLAGQRVEDLAPELTLMVSKRIINKRTVLEALTYSRWIQDLRGVLSWEVLMEITLLWEIFEGVNL
jgi:hypothetical protein